MQPSRDPDAGGSKGRLRLAADRLDDLDAAIFDHLQDDSRRPYRTIAQELGVPEGTVRFRVNRLVREGIVHLTATIHPQRLGGLLITLLVRVELPHRQTAIDELAGWPEVMYFSSYTGRADLMLQVATGSLAELNELVTQRMRGIEGSSRSTHSWSWTSSRPIGRFPRACNTPREPTEMPQRLVASSVGRQTIVSAARADVEHAPHGGDMSGSNATAAADETRAVPNPPAGFGGERLRRD